MSDTMFDAMFGAAIAGGGSGGFTPTETQLEAMNSGITATDVEQITTNKTNISKLENNRFKEINSVGTSSYIPKDDTNEHIFNLSRYYDDNKLQIALIYYEIEMPYYGKSVLIPNYALTSSSFNMVRYDLTHKGEFVAAICIYRNYPDGNLCAIVEKWGNLNVQRIQIIIYQQ